MQGKLCLKLKLNIANNKTIFFKEEEKKTMKKQFTSTKLNKRANHNVTIDTIALNKAIQDIHVIPQKKKRVLFDVDEITETTNDFYHELIQKEYSFLFAGYYPTKEEFITSNYETITKGFIKALALKCNVGFCIEIINKGYYGDTLFDDLCQEVALCLLENKDKITLNENNVWCIPDDIKIACLRSINNYGYRNKTRVDKTQVAIVDYDEKTGDSVTIAINTRAYTEYCLKQYNNMSLDEINSFYDIIDIVKLYIAFNQKNKISIVCNKIIDLLIQGYKKKDIVVILDISKPTLVKYCNIIQNAYYECYKKPVIHNDKIDRNIMSYINFKFNGKALNSHEIHDFKQGLYNMLFSVKNNTINIDFTGCYIINNNNDILIDRINKYYHDKKQAFYNVLFRAYNPNYTIIDNTTHCTLSNTEKLYRNELWIDRNF